MPQTPDYNEMVYLCVMLAKKIIVPLLIFILTFLIFELVVRYENLGRIAFSYEKTKTALPIMYTNYIYDIKDPKSCFNINTIIPGKKGFFKGVPISINSFGMRDREYSHIKPDGTFRILIIGESTTFGSGVEIEKVFHSKVEKMLNERNDGEKYEILNWSHAFSSVRCLIQQMWLAPAYHPNMVFLYLPFGTINEEEIKVLLDFQQKTGVALLLYDLNQSFPEKLESIVKDKLFVVNLNVAYDEKNYIYPTDSHPDATIHEKYAQALYEYFEGHKKEILAKSNPKSTNVQIPKADPIPNSRYKNGFLVSHLMEKIKQTIKTHSISSFLPYIKLPIFILIIFAIYWILPLAWQNSSLLFSSYILYGLWDWRFLILLIASSFADYVLGFAIHKTEDKSLRRQFLVGSVIINIGTLFFFKYFNFFLTNFTPNHLDAYRVIVPLGMSYYSFQKLTYTIDIYKKKMAPAGSLIDYLLYVSYFPKLISGPIERAQQFIPKLQTKKLLKNIPIKETIYLLFYGAFKKLVIADSLSVITSEIFSSTNPNGAYVLLASYLYFIQIYVDFSGYTDLARGVSNLFGLKLSSNFNFPFFSKNPLETYKKWHITLTEWMRDYIYLPLFFYLSSKTAIGKINDAKLRFGLGASISLLMTFIFFGLWHAAWHYLLAGLYMFVAVLTFIFFEQIFAKFFTTRMPKFLTTIKDTARMIINFNVFSYSVLLFALQIPEIKTFTKALFTNFHFDQIFQKLSLPSTLPNILPVILLMVFLFIFELIQYRKKDEFLVCKQGFSLQALFYLALFFLFINIGPVENTGFIYFRF